MSDYVLERIAESRLADLRAAGTRQQLVAGLGRARVRQRAGQALIRAGRWIAGAEMRTAPGYRAPASRG